MKCIRASSCRTQLEPTSSPKLQFLTGFLPALRGVVAFRPRMAFHTVRLGEFLISFIEPSLEQFLLHRKPKGLGLSNAVEKKVLYEVAADLRVPERVLRTIVEDMPDRLLLLDLDLTIRFANRGIFDTSREQLPGRSILEFVPEREHERVRGIYAQAVL